MLNWILDRVKIERLRQYQIGRISLPATLLPPEGGMTVEISVWHQDFDYGTPGGYVVEKTILATPTSLGAP